LKMTFLARGLPHYAHLLGMYAARAAVDRKSRYVFDANVDNALGTELSDVDQSIKEDHSKVITSQRKRSLV